MSLARALTVIGVLNSVASTSGSGLTNILTLTFAVAKPPLLSLIL